LKRRCNRALASQWPAWLADHPKEGAFDLHDAPYYGKDDDPDDPDGGVCRGEARAGTPRFYRCATVYVRPKDVRFTLAVEFVRPGEDLINILKRLVRRVKALNIRLKRGYLDKGFCSIPVMRGWLAEPDLSIIMTAPSRASRAGPAPCVRAAGVTAPSTPFVARVWRIDRASARTDPG